MSQKSEQQQAHRSNKCVDTNKESIIISSNFMIKHVNGSDISRSHALKIRPNAAETTYDLMDYV